MIPLYLTLFANIPLVLTLEKNVDYYQKLWDDNIKNVEGYVRPMRNHAFEKHSNDTKHFGNFDYIIVGAGSAGATLAARLASNTPYNILLIEAGGEENDFSQMPGATILLQCNNEFNWGYRSVPQANACLGLHENTCGYPRGKGLGGSSIINAMLYTRNTKADFDEWEEMGNKGWNYDSVKPYFIKLENASGLGLSGTVGRGSNGPVHLSFPKPSPSYSSYVLRGLKDMGYKVEDYNNGETRGKVALLELTTKNGRRYSVNQAYLKNVCGCGMCKHLTVLTKSLVIKILHNRTVANGIQFINNGYIYNATAKKEVIISAGAVNTPQLLMLSGIGPEDHLNSLGITPQVILPVGHNFCDHPGVFLLEITTNLSLGLETSFTKVLEDYVNGQGEMTYSFIQEIAFQGRAKNGNPIIEYLFYQANAFVTSNMIFKALQFKDYMKDSLSGRANSIFAIVMLTDPKSKGSITLKSKDPLDYPNIDPNFLSVNEDLEDLCNGVMTLYKIVETPTFKSMDAKVQPIIIPACEAVTDAKEKMKCIIKHKTDGTYHASSTCRMGNDPKTSVVDNTLRVHGFRNLRIVDMSVPPKVASAHVHSIAIMLAEKKADEIINPELEKERHG